MTDAQDEAPQDPKPQPKFAGGQEVVTIADSVRAKVLESTLNEDGSFSYRIIKPMVLTVAEEDLAALGGAGA